MQTRGIVPMILPVHILAGVLALVFGYVALFAAKGATLHRKSGMQFVFAMVTLSLTGALVAFLNTSSISVVAGLLTLYFVTTALLTVRRRLQESHWIDAAAMLFALTVALLGFRTGVELLNSGRPETIPMFIFGGVGLLAAAGDMRMIRARGLHGPRRIGRHLWRMCLPCGLPPPRFFGPARQSP